MLLNAHTHQHAANGWLNSCAASWPSQNRLGSSPACSLGRSFVTSKEIPTDLDVLLVIPTDLTLEALRETAELCLTMSKQGSASMLVRISKGFQAERYCWGYCLMINNDHQLKVAQQTVENLQHVLLAARKIHNPREYRLMSAPILLELQWREQKILEYLTRAEMETIRS